MMITTRDLVDARIYTDEHAVIEDALRHLLRAKPELRINIAVYRYQREALSLAQAAELAGVSWPQMKEILIERSVTPRLGATSLEEVHAEVEALRNALQ